MGSSTSVVVAIAVTGCVGQIAAKPKTNEVVAKTGGRHVEFRGMVSSATFCPTCGRDAPIVLSFGAPPRFVVTIPLCYEHASLKLDGGKDHPTVSDETAHAMANEGQLDIVDCIASHVTGTLTASWDSGLRIEAKIDTALVPPGAGSGSATAAQH